MSMRFLPCGDSAVLVELDDLDAVLSLHAELASEPPPGVVDLVPAARTLLLRVDSRQVDVDAVTRAVAALRPRGERQRDVRTVEIPVIYDGEDLSEVGRLTGLGERGVVAAHTGQTWTVAFTGFAPGFGYLIGEDDRLHVPRRANPRTRVPTGAVGLAGEFSGVYPRESPGGWQLLGRTHRRMWDLQRNPPALLAPGVRVRFVEVPAR
ncbi:5-oxoprolinase subunit PxpB [Planosporangium flavigriseum]|uniref:Allophanate hydrolase n=1 Tax=Planosporangium flavigriseum TaxID=373681 RepID=A0A8J3PNA5_9ACTN|nr:5-oxoprolinase subunit PxpB [Planosporangium flavigriseum]GIG75139.1 allophanate hydrolase [Planosporangium flavigriseum]